MATDRFEPMTVVVCEERPLFRESFDRALRADGRFDVVGVSHNRDVAALRQSFRSADVVIVGAERLGRSDVADLAVLRSSWPRVGLVILVSDQSEGAVRPLAELTSMARSGYALLLEESIAGFEELAQAVVTAGEGRVMIDAVLLEVLLRVRAVPSKEERLSSREVDVLHLMAAGFRNKAIAASLHITGKTVDRHIQSIYAKVGEPPESIQPRAHAIAYYRQTGGTSAGNAGVTALEMEHVAGSRA